MKKTHLIGIIIIAVAIGAIITSLMDAGTYADFSTADANAENEYHVVGRWDKTKESVYEPQKNANVFTFYMIDNKGKAKQVILAKAKPQDFEKTEQVVVIGKSKGADGSFVAEDILMKCPSKYNDGQPTTATNIN
jgi:cytochrome c-type biogenesis protein CcmE